MDLARYAELFRAEAREHLAGIEAALGDLQAGSGRPAVDALLRATHTIKGMAGAMGYASVEQLAHAIESRLVAVRATPGDLAPVRRLVPLLQDAADALAQHVDEAVEGREATAVPSALLARLAAAPDAGDGVPPDLPPAMGHLAAPAAAPPRAGRGALREAPRDALRHARVDLRHLDALLDLAGELVIARDQLLRAAEASGDLPVRRAANDTARLVTALQEEVLAARLVPVGQVFDRFPRLVRETARDLDKPVDFVMTGRDLAIDRSLLDAIVDPVIHLLRNAIDHGLESAAVREAAGKPVVGRLTLSATRERDALLLAVADDGRGIDRKAVRERAVAEGRRAAAAGPLDDDALARLLAEPGFSTAERVSAVSGRGVGIDVVATRVRAMGGALSVRSVLGQGTTFTLHLPLTIAFLQAQLVRVAGSTYAVPSAQVLETCALDEIPWRLVDEREAVVHGGALLPLVRLRARFGAPAAPTAEAQVLVLETGGRRFACAVDGLLGQQDVVVKPYDAVAGAAPLFSGATILGDGRPALIVDTGSLA